MNLSELSSSASGWIAVLTGAAAIAALVFIILLYTVGQPFGTLNDICNGLLGILSAVLAWRLMAAVGTGAPLAMRSAAFLAAIGAVLTVAGSLLVISQRTGWVLAGWYSGFGFALVGLWLAAFSFRMLGSDALPHGLVVLGLVAGICLAFGLLAIGGILGRVDSMEALPWYLYLAWAGFLGVYILYPAWAIWIGRILIAR